MEDFIAFFKENASLLKNLTDYDKLLHELNRELKWINYPEIYSICKEYIDKERISDPETAMDYLTKNDPYLTKSLKLADYKDYELHELDSLYLASFLYQDSLEKELNNIIKLHNDSKCIKTIE